MRSTQKKGPRTRAVKLMHERVEATALANSVAKSLWALSASRQRAIDPMYAATQTSTLVNAKWRNGVSLLNSGFDAHGATSDAIGRAAGFREPPEPEPCLQEPPRKPLAPKGGAQP